MHNHILNKTTKGAALAITGWLYLTAVMPNLQGLQAQNTAAVPMGLYAPMYAATTTIKSGGNIAVGAGGNWFMGGNVVSADKGDSASPNTTGRSEVINFIGTGTYSNAAIIAGTKGNIIDGYAGISGKGGTMFLLPIGGADSIAYPFTCQFGANLTVAYFAGTGNSSSQTISGITGTATVYKPFLEFNFINPIGGNSVMSWPSTVAASLGTDYLLAHIGAVTGDNSATSFVSAYKFGTSVFTGAAGGATNSFGAQSGIARIAFASVASVLPVTLLSFTGVTATGGNQLNWKVSNAVNFSHFDLQRHGDNNGFATIATVPYNASNSFSYLDAGVISTNYYRLSMVDLDGTIQYSNTVVLTGSAGNFMVNSIYPNPGKNIINVATYSPLVTNAVYTITDVTGRKVLMEKHAVSQVTTQAFNISSLAAGSYLLSVNVDGVVSTGRFVKQ